MHVYAWHFCKRITPEIRNRIVHCIASKVRWKMMKAAILVGDRCSKHGSQNMPKPTALQRNWCGSGTNTGSSFWDLSDGEGTTNRMMIEKTLHYLHLPLTMDAPVPMYNIYIIQSYIYIMLYYNTIYIICIIYIQTHVFVTLCHIHLPLSRSPWPSTEPWHRGIRMVSQVIHPLKVKDHRW